MTTITCLAALALSQAWTRAGTDSEGRPYGPGWFKPEIVWQTLLYSQRKVARRLVRRDTCLACNVVLDADSEGDHIVPLSRGGPDCLDNFAPLCRRCNSSKGARDLLQWWLWKGRTLADLDPDILCLYACLLYRLAWQYGDLTDDAPPSLVGIVHYLRALMPSEAHWQALLSAAQSEPPLDLTGPAWCGSKPKRRVQKKRNAA